MAVGKKKESTVSESEKGRDEEHPVVRQVIEVVEVIDEEPQTPPSRQHDDVHVEVEVTHPHARHDQPEELPEEPQASHGRTIDELTESEPPTVEPPVRETEIAETPDMDEPQDVTEKQKATVESLFSKNDPVVLPEISVHTPGNSGRSIFVWAMIMLVIALVIGGALVLFTGRTNRAPRLAPVQNVTPTQAAVTATPSPSPTPSPMAKDQLKIQVLNGGGTTGAAGKMREALTTQGYKVANTGNTEEYTYEQTEIHVKPAVAANLADLETALKEDYTVGKAVADLPADSTYDVQIIVGKE